MFMHRGTKFDVAHDTTLMRENMKADVKEHKEDMAVEGECGGRREETWGPVRANEGEHMG
jgi:hypothetical protein